MPRISELTGHPGESKIPELHAQGLKPTAIARHLSSIGPTVSPRSVAFRIDLIERGVRKALDHVRSAASVQPLSQALHPADARMLPAVDSYISSITNLENRATRMLDQAEEAGELNAGAGLIRSALACIRQRAELAGVLHAPAAAASPQILVVMARDVRPAAITAESVEFLDDQPAVDA